MNKYLVKIAGVAEDQSREAIYLADQEDRPYQYLTPEKKQLAEAGAIGGATYLGSKALGHVHAGFGKAAPGLALATGLYDMTNLGSKVKESQRERERVGASRVRNYLRNLQQEQQLQKQADDTGYFEPAAVGAVAGGLTGALAGGSLGLAGGEMALDSQRQVNEISNRVNAYFKKVPLVTLPEIETTNPSRVKSLMKGIGKGLKYGAMAGAPLGASLFVYDQYKRNQHEKEAMSNVYLEKIAMSYVDTAVDDTKTGAKAGLMLGAALPAVMGRGLGSVIAKGTTGAMLGVGVGLAASIPHHLIRDKKQPLPRSSPIARPIYDSAVEGGKTGLVTGAGIGASLSALGAGIGSGVLYSRFKKGLPPTSAALKDGTKTAVEVTSLGQAAKNVLKAGVTGGFTGAMTGLPYGVGLGVPLGAATSLANDYNNRYLQKAAEELQSTEDESIRPRYTVTAKGREISLLPGMAGYVVGKNLVKHFLPNNPYLTTAAGAAAALAAGYGLGKNVTTTMYKEAEDWSPDSYARRLGYSNPKADAVKAGLTASLFYPVSSEQNTSQNLGSLAATGLSAHQAHEEAVMKNQIIQELLQAQEHGIKTGDMSIFESLRDEFLSDVGSDRLAGRILGGISGAALGGMLGHAVGNSGAALATGALVGTGLGALGLGYVAGKGAEKENRQTNKLLDSRHSHLAALLSKTAEEIAHDYKPALAAGGIDAAMGLGLGALGQQISKHYLGGKYAPLVIGGLEGTAAMAATDIYQRKHEAEMRALQERLQG